MERFATRSWVAAVFTLFLTLAVGIGACDRLAGRSGSSIRTENPWTGIDFVVRATSDGSVSYLGLAAGTDGLIRQSERPPVVTTIAVLDAVSCRVLSAIVLEGDAHVWVGIDTAGQVDASPYDPRDFGTWPAIGERLPDAPHCAGADPDPRSTPAPILAIHDGIRVDPGAIDCQISSGPPFDTRIESVIGAVVGCVAHDDDLRPSPADQSGVTILNPGGDRHRLAVAWDGTACTSSATASLSPTLAGYHVNVISISAPCGSRKPRPFGVVISVVDAIDAAAVTTSIDRVDDP
jgi:hypothetical protein